MKRTPIPSLVGLSIFMALAAFILLRRFYGVLNSVGAVQSMPLWITAVVCFYIAYMVHKRRKEGRVGLDRSQLNPMLVTYFMLFGKACAWAGSIFLGLFAGLLLYIGPRLSVLVAAQGDLPGTLGGVLGGLALASAGVVLERCCEVSPPGEGEAVG